ncbi:MAG TPA: tRNA (adenosine(37)-N6)-threonylcarbamoyltransferase complex transferase subunit TsaD [Candidatus Magasanikbacteria bacterium]|nr:tRNA (adenosine(37)-N6)-threonylcarbamoyltransferase complex transferase subunit TsaD [Candidatus Magasanikbacteria bacterium]
MKILGIETSCDETSVALVEDKGGILKVVKNLVYSQIPIHRQYGGVVPEVAARRHVEKIIPLIKEVIKNKPQAIAVTAGPGLATALLVGIETAKTLSYLLNIPLVRVNHIEGHIYSNFINQKISSTAKIFPALCLVVSGGHTELILMKKHLSYKLIGQTRDDAVGECFDKVGKILNLPYPGGPEVAKLATKGNHQAISFPRPMIDTADFDFSFSGLKTAVFYQQQKNLNSPQDICASFQQAAIDVLISKTLKAIKKHRIKTILTGGGVAANQELQRQLQQAINEHCPRVNYQNIQPAFCGDNAAMIAAAGYYNLKNKKIIDWQKLKMDPQWELV